MQTSSEQVVRRATLPPDVALHARPAGLFVRRAAAFPGDVQLEACGRHANAKSILEVLALGAVGGTELSIHASGDGAAAAADDLAVLVAELA